MDEEEEKKKKEETKRAMDTSNTQIAFRLVAK